MTPSAKSDVGNYAYPLAGSALPHAVTSLSGGAVSTTFTYDPNGNQTTGLGRSISYTSYNKPASITSQWYDFIGSGGSMVGLRVLQPNNSVTTRYFHTDNLGSIAVITDESGAVVERDSYDAWGKRRFPNGAADLSGAPLPFPVAAHRAICELIYVMLKKVAVDRSTVSADRVNLGGNRQ